MVKAIGAAQIIAGAATVFMAASARRGSVRPYEILPPLVCLGYWLLIIYATYVVSSSTPGELPLALGVVVVLLAAAATAMLALGLRRDPVDR